MCNAIKQITNQKTKTKKPKTKLQNYKTTKLQNYK
jgi:hypothetical protein